MKTDRLAAAEPLTAHAYLRGELSAPSRRDRHPFVPLATYLAVLCPGRPPEQWAPNETVGYDDILAGLLGAACAIRDDLLASTCDLTVARTHVETLRALAAAHAARLDEGPFEIDDSEMAERAVTGTVRLAQISDVCLAGCGDRAALVRLAEAAETCAALCANGYLRFAVGARQLLAMPEGLGEWLPGRPPLPVIGTALQVGVNALAQRESQAGRAPSRETHTEAIDDDRPSNHWRTASAPEPEPEAPQGPGVVLIPRVGGGEKGTSNKEVQAEYKGAVGRAFPLYPFPKDRRALVEEAAAEAPHARGFFEALVALQDAREHWALPPFVAIGEPGGGKTTAIDAFFRRCGLHVERMACDGSSDAAAAGTPRRWSSGEINLPLRACLTAGHANPAVLWDEISRAGGHTRGSGGTLRDALTSLLEPANSCRYRDPYLEAEVDISPVMHAATANGTDGIASQVLDRLRVLRFPLPGPEHLPVLARRMALDIVRRQGLPEDHAELDRSDLRSLSVHWQGGSLRALKRLVEVAIQVRLTAPFETRH